MGSTKTATRRTRGTTAERTEKLKEPEDCRVVLLNDNFTPMDFVTAILVYVFHKSVGDATKIMLDVHKKGRGVVGYYSYDIGRTLAAEVHKIAREHEFPLRCSVEK
jgi:ATP-dependent Clp protease adaptor protein ClpS